MHIEQITLQRTPVGLPEASDFAFGHAELPQPEDGQVLVRVLALSLDPYLRSAMAGRHLSASIGIGDLVRGEGLVEVLASRHPAMAAGEQWVAACGWRSHALLDAAAVAQARRVPAWLDRPTLALGGLGMPGLTAWAGLNRLADARAGDTLVVSAASGPVGATVGQLAKIKGCRVIGIAGGPEKCAWVTGVAGFDACIDYRAEDLRQALDRLCPQGVDVYFDNVGGDTLLALLERLALGARVVLCGLMAQYNGAAPTAINPALLIRARATMRGLVVYDHWDALEQMLTEMKAHYLAGRLQFREDIAEGLQSAPAAFVRLMQGRNQGKALVRL
jgi:NADPH-dependent curcumin reductase CurA